VTSLDILCKHLLIMELRFDMMLCSNLGNEDSDAGHIKCSRGPHLVRGSQVPHPSHILWKFAEWYENVL